MFTRTSSPMLKMFNRKIKKLHFEKNSIYINKTAVVEIGVVDGIRWIIVGDAGSGKSYLLGVVLNQLKNVFMFDPTGKFRDTVDEMDSVDKWQFYELSPKNKPNNFKINVNELHPRILDSLFPRSEDTEKKRKQRQAIEEFLQSPVRTYDAWEKMCEENKLDALYTDMRWILSENDSAPHIIDMIRGKKSIVCEEISIRNPSIGVFLQSLIGARSKMPKSYLLNPDNFVLVALDEAQDYCRYQTPVGNAFATLNLQARKYGIGEVLVGSAYDNLHPDVRAKSNMKYIFSSPGLTNSYKREGINIIQDDWLKLEKYECFIFSGDGKFNGAVNNDMALPDLYYKEIREINKMPQVTIAKQDYHFRHRLRLF